MAPKLLLQVQVQVQWQRQQLPNNYNDCIWKCNCIFEFLVHFLKILPELAGLLAPAGLPSRLHRQLPLAGWALQRLWDWKICCCCIFLKFCTNMWIIAKGLGSGSGRTWPWPRPRPMCMAFNFPRPRTENGHCLEVSRIHNVENIFCNLKFALLCQPAPDLHK